MSATLHQARPAAGQADRRTLPAARAPRSAGGVGVLAVVLAVVTAVLGVVLLREAFVVGGVVPGDSWVEQAASAVDGLEQSPAAAAAGLAALVLGVLLLVAALRRRGTRVLPLTGDSGAYLHAASLLPLTQARASGVPGVVSARSRGGRRRLRVDVLATGDGAVEDAVRERIRTDLRAMARPPALTVHVRQAAGSVPAQPSGASR